MDFRRENLVERRPSAVDKHRNAKNVVCKRKQNFSPNEISFLKEPRFLSARIASCFPLLANHDEYRISCAYLLLNDRPELLTSVDFVFVYEHIQAVLLAKGLRKAVRDRPRITASIRDEYLRGSDNS